MVFLGFGLRAFSIQLQKYKNFNKVFTEYFAKSVLNEKYRYVCDTNRNAVFFQVVTNTSKKTIYICIVI